MTEPVVCAPLRGGLIAMALTLLAACHPDGPDVLAPLGAPAQLQSAAPRVNSAIPGDRRSQTSFEARGRAVEPVLAPPRG
jgi:hypothetical protein